MNGYLTPEERVRLKGLREHDSFTRDVMNQVDVILASRSFARMKQKAHDFLGYVVTKSLLGEADKLRRPPSRSPSSENRRISTWTNVWLFGPPPRRSGST